MSSTSVPWGRGTGEGIGLSGHKNEYKTGVRIGNWVEEQFSQEAAAGMGCDMEKFLRTQQMEHVAKAKAQQVERNERIEPNVGVPSAMLFSHGKEHGEKYGAAMSALHFSDPAQRAHGAESNDRVHKTFFYGSKHIDQYVPDVSPNPRMELTMGKQAQWAQQQPAAAPSYQTTAMASSMAFKGIKTTVPP